MMTPGENSRHYEPVRQKPACCVPACLRMIFNRHNLLPGLSQEAIGQPLGLVVPPEYKKHFRAVAVSGTPPFGTRINLEGFRLEDAFRKWRLPLDVRFKFTDEIRGPQHLKKIVNDVWRRGDDCILCVRAGVLEGDPDTENGHVLLLADAGKKISYIDPGDAACEAADYRTMYSAMKAHGPKKFGGLWIISPAAR